MRAAGVALPRTPLHVLPMSETVRAAIPAIPRLPVRVLLLAALLGGGVLGYAVTGAADSTHAIAGAGAELTRLLRAMAVIKLALVAGAVWLVDWRLRFPARPALAAGYVASLAAMAAGPGLIWAMAHVAAGAVLMHGGLAALLVLLWRDPGSPAMLPRR